MLFLIFWGLESIQFCYITCTEYPIRPEAQGLESTALTDRGA
jgi:hypothetical protein